MSDNLKYIQTRIKHKIGTVNEWKTIEDTFVPLDGELIIYRGSEGADEETIHFKIGDDKTPLKDLPFAYDKELLALATAISAEIDDREKAIYTLSEATARKSEGIFYIEGVESESSVNDTSKISVWVGKCSRIDALTDGLTIRYKIPVKGNTTTKLKLTYGSGESETTSESTIYRFNDTKLTTQFSVGSIITLIYHSDLNSGCWITNDYDSNTNTQMRVYRQTTGYNADYPLLVSRTKAADIAKKDDNGSYEGIYGVMWNDTTKVPTLNPSTGEVKAPKFTGDGSSISDIDADNITSGTLNSDRLNLAGTITDTDKVYAVGQNSDGNLVVKVPWVDTNSAHSHSAGVGLSLEDSTVGGTSGTVGYKAKLKDETPLTTDAEAATETANRVYPVAVDKSGNLAVNVPWVDTDTHQTIKQDGIIGAAINRYGSCTAGATAAVKTVSITSGTFNLTSGAKVTVKFPTKNTADNPKLNVEKTGAKDIYHNGSPITTGSNKALLYGVCDFVYDGARWHLVGNYIDTTYSSLTAEKDSTAVSLVTRGEKYNWNNHTHSYIPTSQKGTAGGVATLDTNGLVPSSQLPSYVDDVLEGYLSEDGTYFYYMNAEEEVRYTGEKGKIYVDVSTHKCYRYSGSTYVEIVSPISLSNDTPTNVGKSESYGSSNTVSRSDHQHKLGINNTIGDISGTIYNALIYDGAIATLDASYIYNYNNSYYLNVGYSSNNTDNPSRKGSLTLHSGSNGPDNYINLEAINSTQAIKTITLPPVNGSVITTGNLSDISYINGGTV